MTVVALWALAWTPACGDDVTVPGGSGGTGGAGGSSEACAAGQFEHPAGGCCPAGTAPLADGACGEVGVAAEGCREGFSFDLERGCVPVLPAEACEPGQIAVPGQSSCAPLASCGAAPFGDIPRTADTEHVDGAYGGGDSDGSEQRPWTTIQQAIDGADPGGLIAIAAGSYAANLTVEGKSVTVWGRCPELVAVVGTAEPALGAIVIGSGADQSVVKSIAITGDRRGVYVWGAVDVELEGLWIHHTADVGLVVADRDPIRGEAVLRDSLIEGATTAGIYVRGSELVVERSNVREIRPPSTSLAARGINVQSNAESEQPAELVVRDSLIERNPELGVFVGGASATFEGMVVRDIECTAQGRAGRGVAIQVHPDSGQRSATTFRGSVLDSNREIGVAAGSSDVTIEDTVIRATRANELLRLGWGLVAQVDPSLLEPANVAIHRSLIDGNREIGIGVIASEAQVEQTVICNTRADDSTSAGMAIHVQNDVSTGQRSTASIRHCRIADNTQAGISLVHSDTTIEATLIRATGASTGDLWGDGLTAVATPALDAHMTIESSRIEDHPRTGIASFGATVSLFQVLLSCNVIPLNGEEDFILDGVNVSLPAVFDDRGGNVCGCGNAPAEPCRVASSGLSPPEPPDTPAGP